MKKYTIIFVLLMLLSVFGCYNKPSIVISDTSIHVSNPGQSFGLVELKVIKIDSTFGYPSEYEQNTVYTIVDRSSHSLLKENADVKMNFKENNANYCWRINDDIFHANYSYSDKINLKANTWYQVGSEKYNFEIYFFWKGEKGDYIIKRKPKSGGF